jgi:geranylgeranyl transferase type-2 subunit beta
MSYLTSLTLRLAAGAMRLPEEVRRRHEAFLAAAQNDDGGFPGRQGPSDLYYTGFALRALAMLGGLPDPLADAASRFLQQGLREHLASIDFYSLVFSAVLLEILSGRDVFAAAGRDRRETVTGTLNRLRRDGGGYAKNDRSPHSSTYHTFLAAACKQLVGLPLDDAPEMIELIRSRRRDDGGFVELGQLRQSGTNPTAAAIGLLRLADALNDPIRQGAVAFLVGMQNAEGGLRANARIPAADLLSTFTGLATLADLDAPAAIDLPRARQYVEALEPSAGGFRGGVWDDTADVEYTFYGLGSLAILAGLDSPPGVV